MEEARLQGVVRWFSRSKGYGFIGRDDGMKDIFVHFSAIRGDGFRNLETGDKVEFQVEQTDKGPQAVDVFKIA